MARPPAAVISATDSASAAALEELLSTTLAPWRASSSATARPMPMLDPVTTALRPARCCVFMSRRYPCVRCLDEARDQAAANRLRSGPMRAAIGASAARSKP